MYSFHDLEELHNEVGKDFHNQKFKYKVFQLCYCFETINLALYLNNLIESMKK